jgi:hypothetical protein
MDPLAAFMAAVTVLFGAGGVWTFLAAKATSRVNKEIAAASAVAANQQAATADWSQLMSYWQSEMASLRTSSTGLEVRVNILERQREEDLQFIEDLKDHIWSELPPPPPDRRRHPHTDVEAP